jgi:hypothetical protein
VEVVDTEVMVVKADAMEEVVENTDVELARESTSPSPHSS